MRIFKALLIAVLVVVLALPMPFAAAEPQSVAVPTPEAAHAATPNINELEPLVLDIIRRNPQVILDAVTKYQATSARDRQLAAWKENLKNPVQVDLSNAVISGRANASLTLVEFADFQCPYCIQVHATIKALRAKYKNQMRYAYLHLPLPSHPEAMPAAKAAWAAGQQNKFFEYQDALFALQGNLNAGVYEAIANDLKLDLEKFNQDRNSQAALNSINADIKQAESIGIGGTPFFLLNGVMLPGAYPLEDFETVITLVKTGKV